MEYSYTACLEATALENKARLAEQKVRALHLLKLGLHNALIRRRTGITPKRLAEVIAEHKLKGTV